MEQFELIEKINKIIIQYLGQYNLIEINNESKISIYQWLLEFKTSRRIYAILTESQLIEIYEEIRKDEKKFDFLMQLTIFLRLNLGNELYNQWVDEILFSYNLWEYKGLIDEETYERMPKLNNLKTLIQYPWYITLISFVNFNINQLEFINQLKRIYNE